MKTIQSIETKRLLIRPLTMDDKEDWLEFLQGEGSLDFLPGIEPTLERSEWWISRQLWRYETYNCGLMALINKQTGEFIGQCGLLVQHIDGSEELEIAYHIIPRFRGKGYATEAAQAFKKYAFENKLADSLISLIHVDNEKSKKVAERNGMQCEKITRNCELFPGIPHCVYRIKKKEKLKDFKNAYADTTRADSYSTLEFPGTYYLAYRDIPEIVKKHVRGLKALDFGCGTGRSTRFVNDLGFETIGVDISKEMIEKACEIDPKGDYILIDDGDFSAVKKNSFNLITSIFTFDNIPYESHKTHLLIELRKLLTKNGRIINLSSNPEIYTNEWVSFSTKDFPENKIAKAGDRVKVIMLDVKDRRPVEDIIWPDEDYERVYKNAELEIEAVYYPLGKEDEIINWVSETQIPPWRIYVLKSM